MHRPILKSDKLSSHFSLSTNRLHKIVFFEKGLVGIEFFPYIGVDNREKGDPYESFHKKGDFREYV